MITVVYFQAAFAVLAQILAAVIIQITVKAVCLSSAGQHLCRCPMIDKAMQIAWDTGHIGKTCTCIMDTISCIIHLESLPS